MELRPHALGEAPARFFRLSPILLILPLLTSRHPPAGLLCLALACCAKALAPRLRSGQREKDSAVLRRPTSSQHLYPLFSWFEAPSSSKKGLLLPLLTIVVVAIAIVIIIIVIIPSIIMTIISHHSNSRHPKCGAGTVAGLAASS